MQDAISQTGQPPKAAQVVEIGQNRGGTGLAPALCPPGIPQQGVHPGTPGKLGKNAAGDVPAADDQDFLHAGILAEQ